MRKKESKNISRNTVAIMLGVIMLALIVTMIDSNLKPENSTPIPAEITDASINNEGDHSSEGDVNPTDMPPSNTVSAPVVEDSPNPEIPNAPLQAPHNETPTPEITPEPQLINTSITSISDIDLDLTSSLDEVAKNYNCIAVTLASYNPQQGYCLYQYGYADFEAKRQMEAETKIRVASLTKVVAMMLAMTLVEEEKLNLDEDIAKYLEYPVRNPNYPDIAITSRMLIQHTSSLYDTGSYNSGDITFNENTIVNLLGTNTIFQNRPPGEQHEYSDFGYVILGAVCEKISGQPLDILAREKIFIPLSIDAAFAASNLEAKNIAVLYNSSHAIRRSVSQQLQAGSSGVSFRFAVGNLTITALDYAKILNVLVNGGEYNGVRILSEESVNEIHITNVLGNHGYMQGLSVRLVEDEFFSEDVYYHTGSAYGTLAQFFYSLNSGKIAVVVTTGSNSGRGAYNAIDVCTDMSEIVWYRD